MILLNIYQDLQSHVYDGLPEFTEDFNPHKEDFPLAALILFKVARLRVSDILRGKDFKNKEVAHRGYEFNSASGSLENGDAIFHLYLKGKANHWEHSDDYRYLYDTIQVIPLTFKTLSKLPQKQQLDIWNDLD